MLYATIPALIGLTQQIMFRSPNSSNTLFFPLHFEVFDRSLTPPCKEVRDGRNPEKLRIQWKTNKNKQKEALFTWQIHEKAVVSTFFINS